MTTNMTGIEACNRLIDHVAFTVFDDSAWSAISSILGIKWTERGFGGRCYRESADGDIPGAILYHDGVNEGMGVSIVLSGQTCRYLESIEGFPGWRDYLKILRNNGARYSRIDVAIDNESGDISYETVREAVYKKQHVRSRGDSWREILNGKGCIAGGTLCVGSRKSTFYLRAYDKGVESKCGRSWMRFEFELKDERSQLWADTLIEQGWDIAVGSLRGCIEFLDPDDRDKNKSRRKPVKWWVDLIQSSRHVIKLGQQAVQTIEKLSNWVHRQMPASLAVLVEAAQGDLTWLIELAIKGKHKMKRRHEIMVDQAKRIDYFPAYAYG